MLLESQSICKVNLKQNPLDHEIELGPLFSGPLMFCVGEVGPLPHKKVYFFIKEKKIKLF